MSVESMKKVLLLFLLATFLFSCNSREIVPQLADDEATPVTTPLTMDTCITSKYGQRRDGFHNGIDLRTKHRTTSSVFAIADGVVKASANDSGHAGEYVKIYHEELEIFTVYAHLSSKYVRAGDAVSKGEVIGVAGETGRTRGEHLHFGIKNRKDKFIDPVKWLKNKLIFFEEC
jgi:murein DD-endopeptidase MepM/ murein hydrolase activator NlpD